MRGDFLEDELAQSLLAAAPDPLLLIDAAGRLVFLNAQAEVLTGYARGELLEQPIENLLHDGSGTSAAALRTALGAAPAPHARSARVALVCRRRDGSRFPVEVTVSSVSCRAGTFLAAAFRDVSERQRVYEALRESVEQFRLTLDEAPIGMAVVGLDGRFLRVNHALCRLVGYSAVELGGLTFQAITHPDDLDIDVSLAGQLARGEIPDYQLEKRYFRKDGTIVDVHLHVSIVRDPAGSPLHYISQIQDITESKRIKRERDESLRWLRTVLDQCPIGICLVYGAHGEHVELNARATYLVGGFVGDYEAGLGLVLGPDAQPIERARLPSVRALSGERSEGAELTLRNLRGELIPILSSAAPIFNSDGTVRGAVVVFEDITPLKRLARLRAEWNSIVAHDLRGPLSSITLAANLLASNNADVAGMRGPLEHITKSAMRLDRMVSDLLDLSRLEVHQLILSRQPTDLLALVRACVDRIAIEAADRRFEICAGDAVPKLNVDADRITQVMDNLLSNAIKYGRPHTLVELQVQVCGEEAAVAVTNTGQGISADELPLLFQRFQRTRDAQRGLVKGLGLGLYIVRELVEAHGGRITATSEIDGKTTFRFTLPVGGAASLGLGKP